MLTVRGLWRWGGIEWQDFTLWVKNYSLGDQTLTNTEEMPRTHAAHDALGRIVLEDGLARMKMMKVGKTQYITVTAKAINEDSEIEDPGDVMDEFPSNPTGVRFCRVCKDFKPIERFSQGRKRFTCEAHLVVRRELQGRKRVCV